MQGYKAQPQLDLPAQDAQFYKHENLFPRICESRGFFLTTNFADVQHLHEVLPLVRTGSQQIHRFPDREDRDRYRR
jgi:hypothetical protein